MGEEGNGQPVRIDVSADGLTAELVVCAHAPAPDRQAVIALAEQAKIQLTPEVNALIEEACAAIAALNGGAASLVIARGVPAQHGVSGHVEFEPGFNPDEWQQALAKAAAGNAPGRSSGSVDHYTKSIFNFVSVGAHVATIVYPFEGAEGRDVFGNPIPAEPATAANFSVDDTLRKQDDGRLIALRPGVLEWGDSGLHVTDKIEIPGNIDFSVGHVDFPGSVHVKGGVRDLFKVIAKNDLIIEGLIEAATIKAGNDCAIRGGMAAKEKGTLEIGRDGSAKYLNNVAVNVGRNLNVDRELVNCRVTVGGAFNGLNCGIAGGALAVAGPAVVSTVGSEMGVATDLRLGSIPSLEVVIKDAASLVPLLEARRAKLLEPLDQLRSVKGRQAPATLERMAELERQVEAMNAKMRPLEDRLSQLRTTLRSKTKVDLVVHGRIYPKVLITAGNFTIDFIKELRGPIRIVLDQTFAPCLCLLDGTPNGDLSKFAKVRRIDLAAGANSAARAA